MDDLVECKMSAYRDGNCDAGRSRATSTDIKREGSSRSLHEFAGSCEGSMRRDTSTTKRLCRFGHYSKGDAKDSRTHNPYERPKVHKMRRRVSPSDDYNIRITNLHYEVKATDLKDLFAEFGPLKSVTVYYDRYGRTLASADVVFHSKNAALKAVFHYNNANFYGRPMNLELTTVSSTVANFAACILIPDPVKNVGDDRGNQGNRVSATEVRGNSIRSGGRRPRRMKRKILSKEELDAQLDCIMNNLK